jgi:hypothetical protein
MKDYGIQIKEKVKERYGKIALAGNTFLGTSLVAFVIRRKFAEIRS